ncbi:uncharacterized protein [Ptychodera flava]|uniref:uncharacterized protein isoform X2 n=1 Tax=Ptychodera flava TaxID=63121 RepID=UPI00396A3359
MPLVTSFLWWKNTKEASSAAAKFGAVVSCVFLASNLHYLVIGAKNGFEGEENSLLYKVRFGMLFMYSLYFIISFIMIMAADKGTSGVMVLFLVFIVIFEMADISVFGVTVWSVVFSFVVVLSECQRTGKLSVRTRKNKKTKILKEEKLKRKEKKQKDKKSSKKEASKEEISLDKAEESQEPGTMQSVEAFDDRVVVETELGEDAERSLVPIEEYFNETNPDMAPVLKPGPQPVRNGDIVADNSTVPVIIQRQNVDTQKDRLRDDDIVPRRLVEGNFGQGFVSDQASTDIITPVRESRMRQRPSNASHDAFNDAVVPVTLPGTTFGQAFAPTHDGRRRASDDYPDNPIVPQTVPTNFKSAKRRSVSGRSVTFDTESLSRRSDSLASVEMSDRVSLTGSFAANNRSGRYSSVGQVNRGYEARDTIYEIRTEG